MFKKQFQDEKAAALRFKINELKRKCTLLHLISLEFIKEVKKTRKRLENAHNLNITSVS